MLSDFLRDRCVLMDRHTTRDDLGGYVSTYTDGASFMAGVVTVSSAEVMIAEQNGLKRMYTITTKDTIRLEVGEIVKRLRDGLLLRVTSNARDMETPAVAVEKFCVCNAEVFTT